MVQLQRILILILPLLAVACTKATPTFDLLDESSIPQPKFSGQTVKNVTVTTSSAPITGINGECDPKVRSILASISPSTSGQALDQFATSVVITCASAGTFSFDLKSLTDLGYPTPTDGQLVELQLRSVTSAGLSRPSYLRVTYSTGNGNRSIWLAGGGLNGGGDAAFTATGGAFKAEIFVNHMSAENSGAAAEISGGGFKARLGAAGRD